MIRAADSPDDETDSLYGSYPSPDVCATAPAVTAGGGGTLRQAYFLRCTKKRTLSNTGTVLVQRL